MLSLTPFSFSDKFLEIFTLLGWIPLLNWFEFCCITCLLVMHLLLQVNGCLMLKYMCELVVVLVCVLCTCSENARFP